jgi:hypothetical protein
MDFLQNMYYNCNQRCVITHKYNILPLRVMKSDSQRLPGFSGDIVFSKNANDFSYQAHLTHSFFKNSANRGGVVMPAQLHHHEGRNAVCNAAHRACLEGNEYGCGMERRWCDGVILKP